MLFQPRHVPAVHSARASLFSSESHRDANRRGKGVAFARSERRSVGRVCVHVCVRVCVRACVRACVKQVHRLPIPLASRPHRHSSRPVLFVRGKAAKGR